MDKYNKQLEKIKGITLADVEVIEYDMLGTKRYNIEITFLFTSRFKKIEQSFSCFYNYENDDLEFESHPNKKKINLSYQQVKELYNQLKNISEQIIKESEEHE